MEQWLSWAMEIQSLAQAGLAYTDNVYDIERYERLRRIAAEIIEKKTEIPMEKVEGLFCNETGYQTPKIDTRAAVFSKDKILLVHENNGTWALPGGWCDVLESVGSNTKKEVLEETGLKVEPVSIIAVQDRNRHNLPVYAYGVCKIFVMCKLLGGTFKKTAKRPKHGIFHSMSCQKTWQKKKQTAIRLPCVLTHIAKQTGKHCLTKQYFAEN